MYNMYVYYTQECPCKEQQMKPESKITMELTELEVVNWLWNIWNTLHDLAKIGPKLKVYPNPPRYKANYNWMKAQCYTHKLEQFA